MHITSLRKTTLRWAALAALGLAPLASRAQYKGTKLADRVGNSFIGNRKTYDIYNSFITNYRSGDYQAAYRPWRELMTSAPECDFFITYYGTANALLKELIQTESDSIQRFVYYQDIEEMLSYAEQHIGALNSFDDVKHSTISRGDIQCWQAHLYWQLRDQLPQRAFSIEEAYNKYNRAFQTVREGNEKSSGEVEAVFLEEYFMVCTRLYEQNKEENLERFLTDYVNCLQSCDKMMTFYSQGSEQWGYYAATHNNIQAYFYQTGAGTVENLITFYSPRIEQHKNDYDYLSNAIHLMMLNGCFGQDLFYQACEYSNVLKADFENCVGLGQQALVVDNNRSVAQEYFVQALKLSRNASDRTLAARFAGDALAGQPRPTPKEGESATSYNERFADWQNTLSAPISYYNQALQSAQEAGLPGQYMSEIYYKLADCYRKQFKFDKATTALSQAREAYPAFSAEKYNALSSSIAQDKQREETRQRNYAARLKNDAAYKKWQAENAKRLAKQRAEEEFWKAK